MELLLQQEMHFNTLCAEFKKMASIWLLSPFAGIGFVMTNNNKVAASIGLEPWTMIGLIGIGGSIGIVVLWFADLRVYQRLLSAVFFWRGAVEYKASWLPPVHKAMISNIFASRVGFSLALIYVAPFCATSGVGIFGLYKGWTKKLASSTEAMALMNILGVLAVLFVIAIAFWMYTASTPKDDFNPKDAEKNWGPPKKEVISVLPDQQG